MVSKNFKKATAIMLIAGTLLSSSATVFAAEGNKTPRVTVANGIISPRTAGVFTVTAKSGANIRKGPGTNYSKVTAVSKGTVLPLWSEEPSYDDDGNAWYAIKYKGKKRWICDITGYAS